MEKGSVNEEAALICNKVNQARLFRMVCRGLSGYLESANATTLDSRKACTRCNFPRAKPLPYLDMTGYLLKRIPQSRKIDCCKVYFERHLQRLPDVSLSMF